ncbi:TRAP transporter large permease [Breoghania sp. L-A4]|uniref:TRAP transporter large permease n=1 Tax=Breoghania sp. L-A4 TaxID=2304600 RepID=UPI000E35B122|nr:TRAP transporter large permease [Breoghania sp. L-A4]AXS40381.1 TRAP transporter large permease [Breoghania sp. L-A4]
MDSLVIGFGGLGVMLLLIAIRVPIAYSMIVVGLGGIALLSGPGIVMSQLKDLAYAQFSIYDLSVVPMFVLMGNFATRIGLSRDLFAAANAWLGQLRGGVAMAAIAACAGFGAVCGSSLATASTMGQVALPELRRLKYSPALATGTVAAGGTLGILIPPSVVLVVYAIIVEANIVTMFAAALIPGLLAVLLFMITIAIYVTVWPESGPAGAKISGAERRRLTIAVLPVLGVFSLVIGGIYVGAFNPTPAAAVGAFLVALYGLARGQMTVNVFIEALLDTAKTTGMIYLILLGAELLKIFLARGGVPQAAADAMLSSGLPPYVILGLLLIALIILGCLMDSLSMILLAIPFFWPVLIGLDFGMDEESLKIWFGVIALIVVELGLITPPVGLNVFIINAIARDVPMSETFKGVMPFFCSEIVRIVLLVSFPGIILFLPRLLS